MDSRHFKEHDFDEYRTWFDDPWLNKQLGPMDDKWLRHVLTDTASHQFSFLADGELVAVAGLCSPTPEHPFHVITDIAVKPGLQRQGIGLQVVDALLRNSLFAGVSCWRACVMRDNELARRFFERMRWRCIAAPTEADSMYTFEFRRDGAGA